MQKNNSLNMNVVPTQTYNDKKQKQGVLFPLSAAAIRSALLPLASYLSLPINGEVIYPWRSSL